MKKNIYTIFIILISNFNLKISAQSYYKIPTDTNHYWRQFSICLPNPNSVNRFDYQIRYFKDTIIQSKTYNKYGTFGRNYGFQYCASFVKNGFLRQDTIAKKVFILDSAYVERPLYDFSKGVNDTLLSYNKVLNSNVTLTIMNVATATLSDGTLHKALWVSDGNCFIEGAGSLFGGLYGHNQAPFSSDLSEQLICFGIISPFFRLLEGISQQQYVCSFVPATVGIEIQKNEYSVSTIVFPNPSNGQFEVEFVSDGNKNISYQIFDLIGQQVLSGSYITMPGKNQFKIETFTLQNGVYFLNIGDNNQAVHKQKIIKH